MAPTTLFEKIWRDHLIADLGDGDALVLVDRVFLHERTGSVALESLQKAGRSLLAPRQAFCTMDHVVDTRPGRTDETLMPTGGAFIRATRTAARRAGVQLFDLGDDRQGIVHVISPEQGVVLPGLTIVCPDSHTSTQGAFGALAWGVGSTEAEHALATGTLRVKRPSTMRITVAGRLGAGVTAKDLALHILARLSAGGAQGGMVEYAGSAVEALSMEGRMTLCNMAAELSAFGAMIAPDALALDYLHGRPFAPQGEAWNRAAAYWRTLKNGTKEAGSTWRRALTPPTLRRRWTWGTSPQHAVPLTGRTPRFEQVSAHDSRESFDKALAYMGLQPGQPLCGLPIDARLHRLLHQRAPLRPAQRSQPAARPPRRPGRARDLRAGLHGGEGAVRGRGAGCGVHPGGVRVARARLLHVLLRRRRAVRASGPGHHLHQPKLREPPGSWGALPSGVTGHRGGFRSRRLYRRSSRSRRAMRAAPFTRLTAVAAPAAAA